MGEACRGDTVGCIEGNVYMDRIGWEAYNESVDLPAQVENYRERFGFYPEVVITDKIYGKRNNRAYLKERGIRYSGVLLGRPVCDLTLYKNLKKLQRKEARIRNRIEGAFGVGKRRYGSAW